MSDLKRVVGYLPDGDGPEQWDRLKERYGVGDSALINILLANEARRVDGGNTKEQALERIEDALQHIGAKVDMALYVAWASYVRTGGMAAKLDVDEVRTLRDSVQELVAIE